MLKKSTIIVSAAFVASIALIAAAPFSRLVYGIWDSARTNKIVKDMTEKGNKEDDPTDVTEVKRKAFLNYEDNGNKLDYLLLIDDTTFQLNHYERNETSTTNYFGTRGTYTVKDNVVTIDDVSKCVSGILNKDGSFGAGNSEEARPGIFSSVYSSSSFALQSNGTFTVGGTSDSTDEIDGLAEVYYLYDGASRPTYKAIALLPDNKYVATSLSLNSKNNEEMAGSFIAYGSYSVKEKDVVPMENHPDEKYDVLTIDPGYGYSWASNNGSLMGFDCIAPASFNQWYMMNLSGTATAETRVSKTGYSYAVGAKEESYGQWSLSFVDAGQEEDPGETVEEYPVHSEVASSDAANPFVLDFYEDGTLITGWNKYEVTLKTAEWKIVGNDLVFDPGDSGYTFIPTWNADGTLTVVVNFGQMGDKTFEFTKEQVASIRKAGTAKALHRAEVASSDPENPFIFEIREDGTVATGWTKYSSTIKAMTWKIEEGKIVFDAGESGYEIAVVEETDGSLTVSVTFGQMGTKVFTIAKPAVDEIVEFGTVKLLVRAEVASSDAENPFILEFYSDGSALTGWTKYDVTIKSVAWKYSKGQLTIDAGETGYSFEVTENEDGSMTIKVTLGQMGDKTFTLTAAQVNALKGIQEAKTLAHAEVASSDAAAPFVLTIKDDGSVVTGWTKYDVTVKTLAWHMEKGNLVIDPLDSGYEATTSNESDGTIRVSMTLGQMGTKEFTISAEEAEAIRATVKTIARLEVASSDAANPFIFEIKEDGSVLTGWTKYAVTLKTITWEMSKGQLVFDVGDSGYTVEVADNEDGSKKISVTFGQMGTKDFTLSADDYAKIAATVNTLVHAEVASSDAANPFIFEVKDDGSIVTGWTKYAMTLKTLTWEMKGGQFIVDVGESGYEVAVSDNEDGSKKVSVTFGQMGTKDFTVSAEDWSKVTSTVKTIVRAEVASSDPENPFIFEVKDDGSILTGWTKYAVTLKTITWEVVSGEFKVDVGDSGYEVALADNEDGSKKVSVTFGQMGTKDFTISASDWAKILAA